MQEDLNDEINDLNEGVNENEVLQPKQQPESQVETKEAPQSPSKVQVLTVRPGEVKFSLGTLVLIFACTFLLVAATFIQINIAYPVFGSTAQGLEPFHIYKYIPQVPAVLFVGALLGRKYGLTAVLLYVAAGLFFVPVFSLGGGLKYIFEYGFGYIFAFIPAAFFTASIMRSGFSLRNIAHASLVGVLTIHLIGLLYMIPIAFLHHEPMSFIGNWLVAQSGIKIICDYILTFTALYITRYLKLIMQVYT